MTPSKLHVSIHTDGGARPNPGIGGYGAVLVFEDQHEQEISGGEASTTNNRMELSAVIAALDSLPEAYQVDLYTDSEYVKNGITQWIKSWIKKDWKDVKNPDLWQRLHQATQRHSIQWHWVKGHAGHEFNERVHELATREIERISGKPTARKAEPEAPSIQADVQIYISADYSFEDKRGGWAAVIVADGQEKKLTGKAGNSSENQLLLVASAAALETLHLPQSVAVYTNSEYIQKGMSQWIKGWIKKGWRTASGDPVKNRELWERLQKAAEIHSVQWVYQTKAGNTYTLRASQLAHEANR